MTFQHKPAKNIIILLVFLIFIGLIFFLQMDQFYAEPPNENKLLVTDHLNEIDGPQDFTDHLASFKNWPADQLYLENEQQELDARTLYIADGVVQPCLDGNTAVCGFDLMIIYPGELSPEEWTEIEEFYFVLEGKAGYHYFGSFEGNINKIIEQAKDYSVKIK
jgi:hypothetical protein